MFKSVVMPVKLYEDQLWLPLPFLYHLVKRFTPFPETIVQPIRFKFLHLDQSLDDVLLLFSPVTFPIVQVLRTNIISV